MMRFRCFVVFSLCVSCFQTAQGQDSLPPAASTQKFDVGLEGMLGVSVGKEFVSVNVGGPGLFLVLSENSKIGVGALPSLYMHEGKLGARLGVSPRIDYKNVVFFAPFFHKDARDIWVWSVGFGYKFHRREASR